MYKVLLFAGTVEGRTVAEFLNQHRIPTRVCVATEYGESLLPQGEYLEISHQRLEQEEMEQLMEQMQDGLVIDATHPYAQIVTENIETACIRTGTAYLRVVRGESEFLKKIVSGTGDTNGDQSPVIEEYSEGEYSPRVVYVKGMREAVEYLEKTEGNILVTTGSKELASYTALSNYQERIYARVLSLVEVVKSCAALGLEGKHLICMQGPFSMEMNREMIRQVNAVWMVTKESGKAGGFMEKYLAARETGCGMIIIGRPKKEKGSTLEECLEYLRKRWGLDDSVDIAAETEEKLAGAENRLSGTEERMPEEQWPDRGRDAEKLTVRKIAIVGIGMGTPDTLTVEGKRSLAEAELLIGAGRMLEQIALPGQAQFVSYKPDEICSYIKEHPEYIKIAVALSGDVGFYSGAKKLLDTLERELPDAVRTVCCGISSMIYFCGKLETAWEDVLPVSLHGRERNLTGLLRHNPRIFAIVGDRTGVAGVCRKLTQYGMGNVRVAVGERLSYPDEKITRGFAEDFQEYETDPLSVLLLEWEESGSAAVTHGISDEEFLRDRVPMTKEEVRSISISKLRLTKDAVIYDVGAGTGSVSVEMALQAVDGKVWAIEKKEEAVELIKKNKIKFRVDNLEIIQGLAPEACEELPVPTHAFIGGSSGNLKEILELLLAKNPAVRVVINCITLETVAEAVEAVRTLPVEDVDIAQVNVAKGRKAGPYHLMMGQNPVYVISFTGAANTNGPCDMK